MNAKLSLLQQFHNGTLAGKGIDGICKALNIPYREKNRLLDLLNELIKDGELFKTPIVRNGKQATVGYCPEIWKTWE